MSLRILRKPMSVQKKICWNNGYTPKFFSRTEFNLCTPSCDLEDMDEDFLKKLDHLREVCDFPMTITCAYRSVEYDKSKGRTGNSYHTRGRAVDIYCTNSYRRFAIVHHAPFCGLNGIGVGSNFVHVDDRIVQTMWTY